MPSMNTYEVTVTLKFKFGEISHTSAMDRALGKLEGVGNSVTDITVEKKD